MSNLNLERVHWLEHSKAAKYTQFSLIRNPNKKLQPRISQFFKNNLRNCPASGLNFLEKLETEDEKIRNCWVHMYLERRFTVIMIRNWGCISFRNKKLLRNFEPGFENILRNLEAHFETEFLIKLNWVYNWKRRY